MKPKPMATDMVSTFVRWPRNVHGDAMIGGEAVPFLFDGAVIHKADLSDLGEPYLSAVQAVRANKPKPNPRPKPRPGC